jgi:hypothetical protein
MIRAIRLKIIQVKIKIIRAIFLIKVLINKIYLIIKFIQIPLQKLMPIN